MTDCHTGLRYRIAGTNREGIVTEVHGPFAMWAELVAGWPYLYAPTVQLCNRLELVPMRDKRGEASIEPGREAA